jgi:two-component system cell cycle sensor histidine kinase/response regulator CckA
VYGVVKQSGGYIWVDSTIGRGSIFRIYLPRTTSLIPSESGTDKLVEPVRGTQTILLVEDEESLRELAHTLLHANGYRVLEASNGRDALEIASKYQGTIHLLLTDYIMPGMNGRALAEKLTGTRPN